MTIYEIANSILESIVDYLECIYEDSKKEVSILQKYLINDEPFEEALNIYISRYNCNLNITFWKRIMMLIIAGKSYIYNNYCVEKWYDGSFPEESLEMLSTMTYEDIFMHFYETDGFCETMINDYLNYTYLIYVGKNQCNEYVCSNKEKKERLLKINPMEIFGISDYKKSEEFLPSELAIQSFFDIYWEVEDMQMETEVSLDNMFDVDMDFANEFRSILYSRYDEKRINEFLLYICSNVYELITAYPDLKRDKQLQALGDYLKETSIPEILEDLKTDDNFLMNIIEIFFEYNIGLVNNELAKRRRKFKNRHGDLGIIEMLNPYFQAEETAFKRVKKTN